MKTAICYLTQNNEVRRTYLKTSLYFLFKHFNAAYKHPVIIFHEGDYDNDAQQDILMSVRSSCRDLVSFQALDPNDFKLPAHIDRIKMERCLSIKPHPTPYWRNEKYRMMCRWWLMEFPKYVKNYDYVMRLDDDSIIEEPIKIDLFQWAADKDLNYSSNFLHIDCGMCCYGMKQFFDTHYPEKKAVIQEMFVEQKIPMRAVQFHPFRAILSITQDPLPEIKETESLWMPVMYYNNFFITKPSFWFQEEVQKTLRKIDLDGSIFYFRWGDAPLQSLIVMLHSEADKISKASFEYSKRLQRESFRGDDGHYHAYMPDTYDKSSCITEQKEYQDKLKLGGGGA